MNIEPKKVLAFFDVDGTLVDGSTGAMMIRYLYSLGMVPFTAFLRVLKLTVLYKLNRLPYRQVYGWTAKLLSGMTASKAMTLTDRAHEIYWLNRYFAEGAEAIRWHKEQGHTVVIATSASEYIGALVRDQLGADDSFGTPMLADDSGMMLDKVSEKVAYGVGKLEMAREYAQKIGADLSDAYFYSDSASDFPLLCAVGRPVMVNPQRKLRALAKGKNWPTVWWTRHIRFDRSAKPVRLGDMDISRWRDDFC